MKQFKHIVTILVFFFNMCFVSCNDKQFEITGNVSSSGSKKPLKKAYVLYVDRKNHHSYRTAKTDSTGNFTMSNLDRKTLGKNSFLLATNIGYTQKFIKINGGTHLNVELEPIPIKYSESIHPAINDTIILNPGENEIYYFEMGLRKATLIYIFKKENGNTIRGKYPNPHNFQDTLHSLLPEFLQLDSLISTMQSGTYSGGFSDDFSSNCIANSEKTICYQRCMFHEGKYATEFTQMSTLLEKLTN